MKSDPAFRSLGFRLHDYFIGKAIDRLKPGGLAAFVTSSGTMDKADARAREHIAGMADLVGAIRLPEGSFRADAGTDVVVDILFFRKRRADEQAGDDRWVDLADASVAGEGGSVCINRWFTDHPEMVLAAMRSVQVRSVRPTPASRLVMILKRTWTPRSVSYQPISMTVRLP